MERALNVKVTQHEPRKSKRTPDAEDVNTTLLAEVKAELIAEVTGAVGTVIQSLAAKHQAQPIQQTNTFNTYILAPIVAPIPPLTNLKNYMEHLGASLSDVVESVRSQLLHLQEGFREDAILPKDLKQHTQTLLDVVDKVTNVNRGEVWKQGLKPGTHVMPTKLRDFNVVYEADSDQLFMHRDGTWTASVTMDDGVQELLTIIQKQHWDAYEVYLIRRMFSYLDQATLPDEQKEAQGLLKHYYNFLLAFELRPYADSCTEEELCGCVNAGPHRLGPTQYRCVQMYTAVEDEFDYEERKALREQVRRLIRENNASNVELLHRCICELYYFDGEFAAKVLALKDWDRKHRQFDLGTSVGQGPLVS
jgi:hypothetical protein